MIYIIDNTAKLLYNKNIKDKIIILRKRKGPKQHNFTKINQKLTFAYKFSNKFRSGEGTNQGKGLTNTSILELLDKY